MLNAFLKTWRRLFLKERSSIGLSMFRFFAAFTVGAHVLPTFLHPADHYFSTAYRRLNFSFFTPQAIEWVGRSPDTLVVAMMAVFTVSLAFFAAGFLTQASCIVMTLGCYYFYALNSLHIGTLSFDILLVTLSLLCATGYPGDYFSVDSRLFRGVRENRERRPFFVQRLLQIQIAFTFFYTGLVKCTAGGNWITDKPLYYLFNGPAEGVIKAFPFRDFFANQPRVCYCLGIGVLIWEMLMPLLLFARRTRYATIADGFMFHVLLVVTMHVPTIFFFLFPAQLLLFVPPGLIQLRRTNAP